MVGLCLVGGVVDELLVVLVVTSHEPALLGVADIGFPVSAGALEGHLDGVSGGSEALDDFVLAQDEVDLERLFVILVECSRRDGGDLARAHKGRDEEREDH